MEEIEIIPHVGVGQFKLGMLRSEIEKIIAHPNDVYENSIFFMIV